ncbi:bifunctional 4-hydroxy-2-oxoglutarate aldolase/2-dehydro-3-deoxy-phosphogluconate aldolase [Nocardioides sp. Kera G14]|uniref:bifunctional 4-hydroxy-2-oxoglutarate aldolase/2-dehydro-3-deoxy-phosphogluconate aldolase n=1 Tax=Nocardioides sp. Kera G14 TaxID=2884264 RepID=UPI001D10C5BD|nr:bifunctional 4-hydroxy-2-oxoglutarate aldolase/2-dehydro-3-deoxy-phosphogluconate aldolase [Nocardioides sp. Kera G14]UDY23956.1 bifunctional 4-hydroxy-2-oxoglutarate aldolase/2-dehydro-3-deoxy-phosphogluconate aldolase [Nocardioides sp. Kera G14]
MPEASTTLPRPTDPPGPTDLLSIAPVIPVVVIEDLTHAVPVARALVEGGLPVIELTLRTPVALEAMRAIADEVPEITLGAGTVTTPELAKQAAAAGASFLVSPGATPRLLDGMFETGLPFLPGTATVSEVLTILEAGLTQMKFFPAAAIGGATFLASLPTVVPTARFCPTGGIRPANASAYLDLPNVGCVGGTWITPADALAKGDWARVSHLAAEAAAL